MAALTSNQSPAGDAVGDPPAPASIEGVLFSLDLSSPVPENDPAGDSAGPVIDGNIQDAEQATGTVDGSSSSSCEESNAGVLRAPSDSEGSALGYAGTQTSPRGPPAYEQIVFVDAALDPDFPLRNADLPGVTVIVLEPGPDALAQIADVLRGYQNLSAIHILSHGAPGEVTLGANRLTGSTLDSHADDLAAPWLRRGTSCSTAVLWPRTTRAAFWRIGSHN